MTMLEWFRYASTDVALLTDRVTNSPNAKIAFAAVRKDADIVACSVAEDKGRTANKYPRCTAETTNIARMPALHPRWTTTPPVRTRSRGR